MSIPPPLAVLFDWDNTLVDNWRSIHQAVQATLKAMGHPPCSFEETCRNARKSARDSFPDLFGERWREAEKVFYESFARDHLKALRPLPGADRMLLELAKSGLYLAVVSNKSGDFLRREAAHLGWSDYFGRIVGATDAVSDKPAVDPVEQALAPSGVARGPAVWFVGDAEIDLQCAHNAGCTAILIPPEQPTEPVSSAYPPALSVSSCAELAALVLNMVNERDFQSSAIRDMA